MNMGVSNLGMQRGMTETPTGNPPPREQRRGRRHGGFGGNQTPSNPGIDTGPSRRPPQFNPMGQMGGLNAGKGSQMHILPSGGPNDSFRQYGTVNNGMMTPPQNPYGPPSNLPTGQPSWGGSNEMGPINTGPSPYGPSPYMSGGGFTGGRMPGGGGMMGGIHNPPMPPEGQSPWGYQEPTPPSMPPMFGGNPFGGRGMGMGMGRGLRGAYGGM